MKINKSQMLFHSVTRLLHRGADAHIRRILEKSHPSEIAAVVRQLPEEDALQVIKFIRDTEKEALTFVELEGSFLQTYLRLTGDKAHIADILHKLPEDEAAALLADLGEEVAQQILSLMKESKQDDVNEILQYGDETCGRIMAVNVMAFNQNLTAKEVIAEIQNGANLESLFYLYIVDEYKNLVGVVSLRQILQVKPDRQLKDFMVREVVNLNVYDSQEKAASYVEEYNFVSLPVVDHDGKLAGMITVDDVIDFIRDEAQEEVLQLAGVEPEAIEDFSYWRAFSSRALWYGFLFLGGVFCSEIILRFFVALPKEVVFLCLAPLVLRLGGSTAIQCITLVHQGILNLDVERGRAIKALWGQNVITFLVAVLLSIAVFAYAYVRLQTGYYIPLGLSLGLVVVTLFSIGVGVVVPVIFHKLKLDSLQASSRFVHFLMDALSLLVFFQFLWFWEFKHFVVALLFM